jgi:hypothetical protein
MENYSIRVTGRNKQGVKQFSIEVSIEPKNFPGGFLQWIGNSRNKDAVSAWLANYCPGYEELSSNGVKLIR